MKYIEMINLIETASVEHLDYAELFWMWMDEDLN